MGVSRATRRASALLALMVALMVMPATIGRADPGEEPDLAIEVVGLKEGSKRDVLIRVTNVSDWWSDTTQATVQMVGTTNGSRPRTYDIPDMNTAAEEPLPHVYEFTYTLPADCYMDVVKASLTAGTNYAGDKEINLDNNVSQAEVCPAGGGTNVPAGPQTGPSPVPAPKPAPKPEPAPAPDSGMYVERKKAGGTGKSKATAPQVFGPEQPESIGNDQPKLMSPEMPRLALASEAERSTTPPAPDGTARFATERAVSITAAKTLYRVARKDFRGGSTSCYTLAGEAGWQVYSLPEYRVGWSEIEPFGDPCAAEVWELAVTFSKSALDAIPEKTITRAILSFDEVEHPNVCIEMWPGQQEPGVSTNCWRSGGGVPEPKPDGCVVVKVPSADWRNGFGNTLVPFITDARSPAPKKIGPREWDVTDAYRWQDDPANRGIVQPGTTPPPIGYGFLLTGTADINKLEAEDNTSCESLVTNIQLTVTFVVPSPDDKPFEQPK